MTTSRASRCRHICVLPTLAPLAVDWHCARLEFLAEAPIPFWEGRERVGRDDGAELDGDLARLA